MYRYLTALYINTDSSSGTGKRKFQKKFSAVLWIGIRKDPKLFAGFESVMDVDPDTKLDLNLSKITQKLATTLVF
jgi:hypothetical protein